MRPGGATVEEPVCHDRIWRAFDDAVAPVGLAGGIHQGSEIPGLGGREVDLRGQGDKAGEAAVRRDEDAVAVGVFSDPLALADAAVGLLLDQIS